MTEEKPKWINAEYKDYPEESRSWWKLGPDGKHHQCQRSPGFAEINLDKDRDMITIFRQTDTLSRLEEIWVRLEAATGGTWGGPWKYEDAETSWHTHHGQEAIVCDDGELVVVTDPDANRMDRADGEFIANAPADIAYLLELVGERAQVADQTIADIRERHGRKR